MNKFYKSFTFASSLRTLALVFASIIITNLASAATFYSGPASTIVPGTLTCLNWGTSPAGPFTVNASSTTTNDFIVQTGTIVNSSGTTYLNIGSLTIQDGGEMKIGSSFFVCTGNVSSLGNGKLTNITGNTTRIQMIINNTTIGGIFVGGGGFAIGTGTSNNITVKLSANTYMEGGITIGNAGTSSSYNNALDLNGFNLRVAAIAVSLAGSGAPAGSPSSKLKASGIESLNVTNTIATFNSLILDQSIPGTTNKLANFTLNHISGLTLNSDAVIDTVNLTAGRLVLNGSSLKINDYTGGTGIANFFQTFSATASGSIIVNAAAGVEKSYPIGSGSANYDLVTLKPTIATTFTLTARPAFANAPAVPASTVSRQWDIASSNPSVTLVKLLAPSTTATSTSPVAGLYISGAFTEIPAIQTGTTWSFTTSNFGLFGVGTTGGFVAVLPVKLLDFSVNRSASTALLTWVTANEQDNAAFTVEHSTNGKDFVALGQVKGNGTTSSTNSYKFEHQLPAKGTNYYRLKQYDFNGTVSYSPVRTVIFASNGLFIKSTAVQSTLNIVTNYDVLVTISIFNTEGKQLITQKTKGEQNINVGKLSSGWYVVRTETGETGRFYKL